MSTQLEILEDCIFSDLENGLSQITNSGIKIHHKPTGIETYCMRHFSKHKNKLEAINRMIEKIEKIEKDLEKIIDVKLGICDTCKYKSSPSSPKFKKYVFCSEKFSDYGHFRLRKNKSICILYEKDKVKNE